MSDRPTNPAEIHAPASPSQDRKRRPNGKALLFVVVFFGGALVAGYLQSPLSTVSAIEVKGLQQVKYEDVLHAAQIQKGMSFWRIRKGEVAEQLQQQFPLIESADVSISWNGEVVIAVVEKSVSGMLYAGDRFYRVLQDGTLMDEQDRFEGNVPILSMDNLPTVESGKPAPSEDLTLLAKQIPEVDRQVLDQISEIRITAEGPWQVFMRDKFEVRIPRGQFADKMKGYLKFRNALGASKEPGIINLLESDYYQPFARGQQKGGA